MTGGAIRTALGEMADRAPRLPMPAGIFDRARKRRRRQRILSVVGAVVALAAVAALSTLLPAVPVTPARPSEVDDMPARLQAAPRWTASIEDAPLPRALVAFSDTAYGDITLVGPDDRYRRYWAGDASRLILSPDGRFLMTERGLLDVTTGVTTSLGTDEPLAFSPDSRLALVARYWSEDEVQGEIRAIDPVSGDFVWSLKLEPGPLPRDVTVAVARDGSRTAIQRHGDLWMYDADGRLLWKRSMDCTLAGQKAFLPDRGAVALLTFGTVCLYDTETGENSGLCHDISDLLMPGPVLGWDQGLPILGADRGVVSLRDPAAKLLEAPSYGYIAFASEQVRWSKREPGPPDAGPLLDRYRPILNVVGVSLLVIVLVLLLAICAIRIRMLGM